MPKISFKCDSCGKSTQRYLPKHKNVLGECECGGNMVYQFPSTRSTTVTETVDKYRNVQHIPDQKNILNQRRDEYYWSYEVPRMVESGKYSIETMLEMQWIYFDEKEQMRIHNKPPHRR